MINYENILKKIGLNIRAERTRLGWSQEKFAEFANVHTNYIGKIERGEQNLTIKKIVNLANILQVPLEEIFNFKTLIR
jgi:transcriptional regulator with XRE-family HTH domain